MGAGTLTQAPPVAPPAGTRALRPGRERAFWPFLLPALVAYTALFVAPSLFGFWVSLNAWAGPGSEMTWRGLGHP